MQNSLHIVRSPIKLNIEKKFHNFKIICRTSVRQKFEDLLRSVILSQIILLHAETFFELMKNNYLNKISLDVANFSRKLIVPFNRFCASSDGLTSLLSPATIKRSLPVSSAKLDINSVKGNVSSQKLIKVKPLKINLKIYSYKVR